MLYADIIGLVQLWPWPWPWPVLGVELRGLGLALALRNGALAVERVALFYPARWNWKDQASLQKNLPYHLNPPNFPTERYRTEHSYG